ncbi:MAG: BNR-4 repeat-containing protein [Kiritimatiellae bacterium]|nr:BNR-4 repeat-containing protein [Kiritimatiellia bacterium]MDD5519858.1 BNR-4 repeat-containing protein [Kiritimatiellia bacterium]
MMSGKTIICGLLFVCFAAEIAYGQPKDDGYRGIWYYNQPSKDEYHYKYSGGFATYPQQMSPYAYYAKEVNKTFFCYGGRPGGTNVLLHMVSFYDHATGQVPRPTILLNKKTDDAHDNPTIMLDDAGYVWIFSASHGTARPSWIHRSKKPYSVDEFEQIIETNFSYTHPWWIPGKGFLFLHTRYKAGRGLFWMISTDGVKWEEPQSLAHIEMGDYQVAWRCGTRLASVFDYHPKPVGLNERSNIYYVETADYGKTWRTVAGELLKLPLTEAKNPALVLDSRSERKVVYNKDVNFDADGRPVILYMTSTGYESGPKNGLRYWYTMRWTGREWVCRPFTTSDHNYDHGSLYIEPDGTWRIIAPTEPGPQPWTTGGEMVLWTSRDQGTTWIKVKQLTRNSRFNHTYARRPVNAHPGFYAFWADGNTLGKSDSCLYFTNKDGDHVWRLPTVMSGEFEKPEVAW